MVLTQPYKSNENLHFWPCPLYGMAKSQTASQNEVNNDPLIYSLITDEREKL